MGKGERKWGGNWGREGINAELQGRIERGWSVGVGGAELFEAVLGGKDGVRVLRRVPGCLPRGGEVVLRQCPRSSVPAGNGFWTAAPSLPPSRCLLASSSPSPPLLPSPLSERHRAPFPLASAAKVCDGLQSTLTFISTPLRALAARTLREGTLPICYGTGPATPAPLAWAVGWVPRGEELRSVQLLFILPPSLLPPSPLFSSFPFPMLCFAFCIGKDPEAGALKPVHPNRPPPRNRRCRRAVHFPRCRSRGEEGGKGTAVPGGQKKRECHGASLPLAAVFLGGVGGGFVLVLEDASHRRSRRARGWELG